MFAMLAQPALHIAGPLSYPLSQCRAPSFWLLFRSGRVPVVPFPPQYRTFTFSRLRLSRRPAACRRSVPEAADQLTTQFQSFNGHPDYPESCHVLRLNLSV